VIEIERASSKPKKLTELVVGTDQGKDGCHGDSILSGSISGVVLFVEGGVTVAAQSLCEMPMAAPSLQDCCALLGKSLVSTDSLSTFSITAFAAASALFILLPTVMGIFVTRFFVTGPGGLAVAILIPLPPLNNGEASFALAMTPEVLFGRDPGDFPDIDVGSFDFVMAVIIQMGLIVAVVVTFDLISSGRAEFTLAAAIFAAAAAIGPA
jgi:hypothetical protein